MEELDEDPRVAPELYFLIAKFLSGGPLKETAKTLLKELESVEVLPRRLDWEGREHPQTYHELETQFPEMSWRRLAAVCARALRLAAGAGAGAGAGGVRARLSVLSEALARPRAAAAAGHSLVRRLRQREAGLAGGAVFPARMLRGVRVQRRTLGHLAAVYCVVFDRSGRYAVTGADDFLVKLWSAEDARLLATLRGATAEITDVGVSPDNRLVACGSVDRLVRVWCLRSGAPAAVLAAHAGTITALHWRPGRAAEGLPALASTSTDGSVAFWSMVREPPAFAARPVQYVERMRPGSCHMICAAWSAGGAFLATGSADHHVRLYSVLQRPAPARVLEVAAHSEAVDSVAWAHRGLRFVSGSKDGTAALWTLHAMQWRHVLLRMRPARAGDSPQDDGRKLKVTMVCWDRSDAFVLTAVSDSSVKVWCSRACRLVRSLAGHRDEAYVLEAHPFLPHVFLSAGHDGQLFVWDAMEEEPLASFQNKVEGQGEAAIYDAKWGGGARLAATDSHGHLLFLGLGEGHPALRDLPTELFFHTDYRPVVRDALGGALDEQTEVPPHLMPPAFLVDAEGSPHPPHLQRLVPGREHLAPSQLLPLGGDVGEPSQLDLMIQALAGEELAAPAAARAGSRPRWARWSGAGEDPAGWPEEPAPRRALVPPLARARLERLQEDSAELFAWEEEWWRREMRRRPLMISTAEAGAPRGPRRRAGRPRPQPRPRAARPRAESPGSAREAASPRANGARLRALSSDSDSDSFSSQSKSGSDNVSSSSGSSGSSSSSSYSDWVAESTSAALAPPARARRRPRAADRYSPGATSTRRAAAAAASSAAGGPAGAEAEPEPSPERPAPAPRELPEAYRPGDWLTAVAPRKAPYHPQMGDECLYFRLGHQRYFDAVAEKDVYKVNPRDKPWERTHVNECELVKVVGIKYVIKPPRIASLKLACAGPGGGAGGRAFTVKYHDMADVIDFLVLRQQYDAAVARGWSAGDRFRCMIDDSWWTGVVEEAPPRAAPAAAPAPAWSAAAAAAHFLSLRVRWDNGELERLSPWDLEPIDAARLPSEAGGCVPVVASELEAALYRAAPHEWPPHGDRAGAARAIAAHCTQVMSLSVAEPFAAPVDLSQYPTYAYVVEYPIDLSTIRARFQNQFYRRLAAAQFDVRYLASNAEQFNERHSSIVRQARLVTDLMLHIIGNWWRVDVLAKYRELAEAYRSDEEEAAGGGGRWVGRCRRVLRAVSAAADAGPFLAPVEHAAHPDYALVVREPCDLATVRRRLDAGEYSDADKFADDMRLIFDNSRLYNTNRRSRIYCMTVRLSALFESLWEETGQDGSREDASGGRRRRNATRGGRRGRGRGRRRRRARGQTNGHAASGDEEEEEGEPARGEEREAAGSASSESETLAATSRRVHSGRPRLRARADSWDSDAPLNTHTKGKGVGKKSKPPNAAAESPGGYGERARRPGGAPGASTSSSGRGGAEPGGEGEAASSTEYENIEVLEEELAEDEVELTYVDAWRAASPAASEEAQRRRKRRRAASSSGSASGSGSASPSASSSSPRPARRRARPAKRSRVRVSSSSRSAGARGAGEAAGAGDAGAGGSGGRYESDHSYRPRYSSDDDAPLNTYRQRYEDEDVAGPSHGRTRSGQRARRRAAAAAHYAEDSEEDSPAAISKRTRAADRLRDPRARARAAEHAAAGMRWRAGGRGRGGGGPASDHNYFNGHAARRRAGEAALAEATRRPPRDAPECVLDDADVAADTESDSDSEDLGPSGREEAEAEGRGGEEEAAAVSISSRGRVRRLTAKARGLLRE